MAYLRILHLSDLHFKLEGIEEFKIVTEALFNDLLLHKNQGLSPDIVVFSGDLIINGDFGYTKGRSDYEEVLEQFINPLLDHLGLDLNNIFFCPGNHDIQRSKIKTIHEEGMTSYLTDRDKVNTLIDNYSEYPEFFERMTNFDNFLNSIPNEHLLTRDVFHYTYEFSHGERKIGIACINTAWRAYGGDEDYGQLIVGERVVDRCIEELSDCDLRILTMHHPISYLRDFERNEIKRRVYGAFSFLLTGHSHEPDIDLVQPIDNNKIILISGGSLFFRREYFNGYSIINYSLDENNGTVNLREYIDRSRSFVPALAYDQTSGQVSFELSKSSTTPIPVNLSIITRIREIAVKGINSILLPSTHPYSLPRELEEVFVEPPLSLRSEQTKKADDVAITLDELIEEEKNVVFIGDQESGKTTLLNFISSRYLEPANMSAAKVPLLLNWRDLPKSSDSIRHAINNYLHNYGIEIDVNDFLSNEKWILLIDDFDLHDKKGLVLLVSFIEEYPNQQYMFTLNEDLLLELQVDKIPDLGIEVNQIYIHSFGRKQIRLLAKKWYEKSTLDFTPSEVADTILYQLIDLNLPRTPFIISIILFVIEHEREYQPINKATLIQDFIEILISKSPQEELLPGGIDFRNIEDLLANMAKYLVETSEIRISLDDALMHLNDYFSSRGLPIRGGVQTILDFLIQRGVLVQQGDLVSFRSIAFFEYFVAKQMIEDTEFYEVIIGEDGYLKYANSIDYLTGLVRKNEDLLSLIMERLKKNIEMLYERLGLHEISISKFGEIELNKSLIESIPEDEKENFVEKLRASRLTEEIKDAIYDRVIEAQILDSEEEDDLRTSEELTDDAVASQSNALEILVLYARLIRNCELIDSKQLKKEHIRFCLETSIELLYLLILTVESFSESFDEEDMRKFEERVKEVTGDDIQEQAVDSEVVVETFLWFMKIVPTMLVQSLLSFSLGTPKLALILEEEIDSGDLPIYLKVFYLAIYTELRLPRYLDKMDALTKEIIDIRFLREIIYFRLRYLYGTRSFTIREQRRLENIMVNIIAKDKRIPPRKKTSLLGDLRRLLSRRGTQ